MTGTASFLTGRKVTVNGYTYRDDEGQRHHDVFLVVGPHPLLSDGFVQLQDVSDGEFTAASASDCNPI